MNEYFTTAVVDGEFQEVCSVRGALCIAAAVAYGDDPEPEKRRSRDVVEQAVALAEQRGYVGAEALRTFFADMKDASGIMLMACVEELFLYLDEDEFLRILRQEPVSA